MFTDKKPYWWNIKSEYIKIEKLFLKAKNGMISGGREWVNDVKEDPVAEFTKGNYTMVGNVSCFSKKIEHYEHGQTCLKVHLYITNHCL